MKHLIKITLVLALCATLFSACNDDDGYSLDKVWISYGTIQGDGRDFTIRLDNGATLFMAANLIPHYPFRNNQRVIANYTILSEATPLASREKGYMVRLNNIYDVLSKKPVAQSFIDLDAEHRKDSIGNDPINVVDAWFGGKYLNVNFDMLVSGSYGVKHFINLVHDDVTVDPEGVVNVTLRHNAYADARSYWGFGRVSFDISGLVPEGESKIELRLKWTDYDGQEKSDEGTFKLNSSAPAPESKLKVDKIATMVE